MKGLFSGLLLLSLCSSAVCKPVADAVMRDPPRDAAHPARMAVVHIPSHGVEINGLLYLASGAGLHPLMIFFHGMPGNEQNLDVAQAVRRSGWNVLTLHYRGSWGSPGTYSYTHLLEDGAAAVAFARDPKNANDYSIDTHSIVLTGHSTGGFVATLTAAATPGVAGLILISGTDDAGEASVANASPEKWRAWVKDSYADSMETLAGCTPDGLAREALEHSASWKFATAAPHLTKIPVLLVTSEDGFAAEGDALGRAIGAAGGSAPAKIHMETDHAYSDHRIALQAAVVSWLGAHLVKGPGA